MNKKVNTFFFIITATVVNVLITIILFAIIVALFTLLIAPHVSQEVTTWASMLIFIIAISLSFIIYQFIIKLFTKKVNMEKYFDPIVAPKSRPKRKE
jgi:hypothetical protein